MSGIDINKIKTEISNRKSELDKNRGVLGENVSVPVKGDKFLAELMLSKNTGQVTGASAKVKAVSKGSDIVANAKKNNTGVNPQLMEHVKSQAINEVSTTQTTPNYNNNIKPTQAEIDKMKNARMMAESQTQMNYTPQTNTAVSNMGIADAIAQYQNTPTVGSPMHQNNGGMLSEAQMLEAMAAKGISTIPNANNVIAEQVTNVANQLLNENFGKLYAEAMKNSIIESYKAEKVKESLLENKKIIKEIVVDVILELQERNKSK